MRIQLWKYLRKHISSKGKGRSQSPKVGLGLTYLGMARETKQSKTKSLIWLNYRK